MTVKELKDKLNTVPDNYLVTICDADTHWLLCVEDFVIINNRVELSGGYNNVYEGN